MHSLVPVSHTTRSCYLEPAPSVNSPESGGAGILILMRGNTQLPLDSLLIRHIKLTT